MRYATRTLSTFAALATLAACTGQVAIDPPKETPAPDESPVAVTMSPKSGSQNTDVTLRADGFPPNQPVDIGFGPPSSEYEVVGNARANARGEVSTTVTVPDWAENGREYVFVVAEAGGGEKAIFSPFSVRARSGDDPQRVQITGVLTGEGVECPTLRGDDGTLYTLAGETGRFGEGDRVEVEGTVAEMSICMQGTTIRVENISDAG